VDKLQHPRRSSRIVSSVMTGATDIIISIGLLGIVLSLIHPH